MIYERIRNLREDKDMTQTEMAEILNCSQRIYSNYERGGVGIPWHQRGLSFGPYR